MKYFVWLLRAAFFFLLFAFSLNNRHAVTVHGFWGVQWQGPLVLAMLVAFALGLALGLATVIPRWRRGREQPVDEWAAPRRASAQGQELQHGD